MIKGEIIMPTEALEILKSKIGDEAFAALDFTDEEKALFGLTTETETEDEVEDEIEDETIEGNEGTPEVNTEEVEDEKEPEVNLTDISLDDIDVESLSEEGKLLYKLFTRERVVNDIKSLGLSDESTSTLLSLQKSGVPKEVLDATAETFRKLETAKPKKKTGNKIVPKAKLKKTVVEKKDEGPKLGTLDFGKLLAKTR